MVGHTFGHIVAHTAFLSKKSIFGKLGIPFRNIFLCIRIYIYGLYDVYFCLFIMLSIGDNLILERGLYLSILIKVLIYSRYVWVILYFSGVKVCVLLNKYILWTE